jgi:hypothetical protein
MKRKVIDVRPSHPRADLSLDHDDVLKCWMRSEDVCQKLLPYIAVLLIVLDLFVPALRG